MRYPSAFKMRDAGGFWEAPGGVKYSCLDTPLTMLIHKNVRYKEHQSGKWVNIRTERIGFGNTRGCQNYWAVWRKSLNGWISSNGGPNVGYPMNYDIGESIPDLTNCSDGFKNGDEYDVDCGGSCPKECQGYSDRDDGDCEDGFKNGDEEYVDCGGRCEWCNRKGNLDAFFKIESSEGFTHDEARRACSARNAACSHCKCLPKYCCPRAVRRYRATQTRAAFKRKWFEKVFATDSNVAGSV